MKENHISLIRMRCRDGVCWCGLQANTSNREQNSAEIKKKEKKNNSKSPVPQCLVLLIQHFILFTHGVVGHCCHLAFDSLCKLTPRIKYNSSPLLLSCINEKNSICSFRPRTVSFIKATAHNSRYFMELLASKLVCPCC